MAWHALSASSLAPQCGDASGGRDGRVGHTAVYTLITAERDDDDAHTTYFGSVAQRVTEAAG